MSAGDIEGFAIDPGKVRKWKRYPAYKDSGVMVIVRVPGGVSRTGCSSFRCGRRPAGS
ncbi:hypothetical protein [Methanoculleus formosensis]|uniref:hypothetical protein n=1 Tax=Methanoculleus formosensis TaxID=2590886 RepID=UPI0021C215DA|nr:hypothetical protein [Methanoculleus sp. Afa-1]